MLKQGIFVHTSQLLIQIILLSTVQPAKSAAPLCDVLFEKSCAKIAFDIIKHKMFNKRILLRKDEYITLYSYTIDSI
jgi:hypothetical protein